LSLATPEKRARAFDQLCRHIRTLPPTPRQEFLQNFFASHPVPPPATRLMLNWNEVKKLAAEPLVTLGAHAVHHYDFSQLTADEVLFELRESRARLVAETGQPIEHFSYPFGGRAAVGPREFALAKTCGYKTATTTRTANIFPAHSEWLTSLPRISVSGNYSAIPRLRLMQTGLPAALQYRFRRIITA
jgi:peptidoglycan/xylan/chitin deacetylase (PgdA/CDA1 family)